MWTFAHCNTHSHISQENTRFAQTIRRLNNTLKPTPHHTSHNTSYIVCTQNTCIWKNIFGVLQILPGKSRYFHSFWSPVSHKIDALRHFCTLCVLRTSFVVEILIFCGFIIRKIFKKYLNLTTQNSVLCVIPKKFFSFTPTQHTTSPSPSKSTLEFIRSVFSHKTILQPLLKTFEPPPSSTGKHIHNSKSFCDNTSNVGSYFPTCLLECFLKRRLHTNYTIFGETVAICLENIFGEKYFCGRHFLTQKLKFHAKNALFYSEPTIHNRIREHQKWRASKILRFLSLFFGKKLFLAFLAMNMLRSPMFFWWFWMRYSASYQRLFSKNSCCSELPNTNANFVRCFVKKCIFTPCLRLKRVGK